jgi:hypothetical protein
MARPRKIIDWEEVKKLCYMQATFEEIASWLGIDDNTLHAACKRDNKQGFSEFYKKHSDGGKCSLRRMQIKAASEGNITMLIWLGKQLLGQRDKNETEHSGTIGFRVEELSDAELDARIAEQINKLAGQKRLPASSN